jgi:hypothetical protein
LFIRLVDDSALAGRAAAAIGSTSAGSAAAASAS